VWPSVAGSPYRWLSFMFTLGCHLGEFNHGCHREPEGGSGGRAVSLQCHGVIGSGPWKEGRCQWLMPVILATWEELFATGVPNWKMPMQKMDWRRMPA
jgi:hypothetical protein